MPHGHARAKRARFQLPPRPLHIERRLRRSRAFRTSALLRRDTVKDTACRPRARSHPLTFSLRLMMRDPLRRQLRTIAREPSGSETVCNVFTTLRRRLETRGPYAQNIPFVVDLG